MPSILRSVLVIIAGPVVAVIIISIFDAVSNVGVMNRLFIPHPAWVWLPGIAAYRGGDAGARLSARAAA